MRLSLPTFCIFTMLVCLASQACRHAVTYPSDKQPLTDSVLLVLAHPDDETMIGSLLIHLKDANIPVHALYATMGEGGKHYTQANIAGKALGSLRMKELKKASQCY